MDGFDLGRLTDYDFEQVCKDLFEAVLGLPLETFAPGADGGVDLRRMEPISGDTLVIQCKHWERSGRSKLVSHIREVESVKVAKLAPRRYILATTVPLTPAAKTKLHDALAPHLLTEGDLYGADELVALLRKHDEIVRRHLRLWLASTAVLSVLLNREIHTRSSFFEQEVASTLETFAPTPAFDEAMKILREHRVCVISGLPGIGKTTLAHVMGAAAKADGYDLYEIDGDIEDVYKVWDDAVPQFFYYDDFLGQTSLRDTVATGEDARLLRFFQRIASSPNKYLVLTTREYILAQARRESEGLMNSHKLEVAKFVLDLSRYSTEARAEILYNHLYFSSLSRESVSPFAEKDVYEPIIRHSNFSPRLVALTFDTLEQSAGLDAPKRLMENLDNPHALWQHMFDHQLTAEQVHFVLLLYTFRRPVHADSVVDLWAAQTPPAIRTVSPARQVKAMVAVLEGTLVRVHVGSSGSRLDLHNPSIRDFLRGWLTKDSLELKSLIQRIQEFEQVSTLFAIGEGYEGDDLLNVLRETKSTVERTSCRILATDLADPDGDNWCGTLAAAINVARVLGSGEIYDICRDALRLGLPSSLGDPNEAISLVHALRKTSPNSELAQYELTVSEWVSRELVEEGSDWESLRVAEGLLMDLGGAVAESAIARLDDRLRDAAEDALQRFLEDGSTPGLSSASEMLEQLREYGGYQDIDGYGELEYMVESEWEMRADEARDLHRASPAVELIPDRVADRMSSLRGPRPHEA